MNLWMIEIYSQQPSDSFTVAYGWQIILGVIAKNYKESDRQKDEYQQNKGFINIVNVEYSLSLSQV